MEGSKKTRLFLRGKIANAGHPHMDSRRMKATCGHGLSGLRSSSTPCWPVSVVPRDVLYVGSDTTAGQRMSVKHTGIRRRLAYIGTAGSRAKLPKDSFGWIKFTYWRLANRES